MHTTSATFRRRVPSTAALGLPLLILSCGGDAAGPDDDGSAAVASVDVSPVADTLFALADTIRFEAVARDAQGDALADTEFTWASSDETVLAVDSAGVATAVGNGEAEVTATAGGVSGASPVAVAQLVDAVTVTPGADTLATVGATRQYGASAVDANGNAVEGARFLWQSSDPTVASVDTAGLATAVGAGTATITASAQGLPGHATLRVEQSTETLAFRTGPTDATAGEAIDPAVQVEVLDAEGNRVGAAEFPVTLALADNPGGGTLGGTKTVNAVAGVASFSGLWLDGAGTGYTLEASASDVSPATSGEFDVAAGAAERLAFVTQPSTADGNAPITPAVQVAVQDAYGNTITGATDSVTLRIDRNPRDAALLGTTTVAAVDGVAAFPDVRVDLPASDYALEAEVEGMPRAYSQTFDVILDFVQVSAGTYHTCGVTVANQAYCWGENGGGQLGDSTYVGRLTPVPVRGGHEFTRIAAGEAHTCGLTPDRTLYCWGDGTAGQLGIGSFGATRVVPAQVSGTYSAVTASFEHTCALAAQSGAAYCWGRGLDGELGTNSTAYVDAPAPVVGGLTFALIDAGYGHTCAVTDGATAQAYCWGSNAAGQLGDNSTAGDSVPVAVSDTFGGLEFVDISAGYGLVTCGVATDDRAYCWGGGALGDGSTAGDSIPVLVSGSTDFSQVSVGGSHSCALRGTDGALFCWGDGLYGQLGLGTPGASVDEPTAVVGSLVGAWVSAGFRHSCAVSTDGLYCWGRNLEGRLGTGSTDQEVAPARVVH